MLNQARSLLPFTGQPVDEERLDSPGSLRWRIVAVVGAAALILLGTLSWLGSTGLSSLMGAQADARLMEAARRSSLLVDALLVERQRQLTLLSGSPAVVDAATTGARRTRELGLNALTIEELERRFSARRSLDVDVRTRRHLQEVLASLDIAELMITDENGFNVITTARTSDFVQSDEAWWQEAFREGHWGPAAEHDQSAGQAVLSSAIAVRERYGDPPVGVIKAGFGLAKMDSALARASRIGGIQVDLIDRQGTVIASSSETARLRPIPGGESLAAAGSDSIITYVAPDAPQRAAIIPVNDGQWRLVTHMDQRVATAKLDRARGILYGTAAALFLLMLAVLVWISHSITRRVSDPAAKLAAATEAVAAGDLSVEIAAVATDDEIGRLTRATRGMIADLHRMASTLRRSATETAGMAAEITIGTEHMSGAAQQTAEMANDLSRQSSEMAETVQGLAGDAGQLVALAAELDAGAHEGVERNARMRELARENRERFTESSEALVQLATESRASIAAAQALAEASEEIRAFVAFVQKMARQSKLLALNAAMEAARAGDRGHGFAVVAGEVRRLATGAAQAAERTEQLVGGVLARAQESRESSARAAETVDRVLVATQAGHSSFEQVERAVIDNEAWTSLIERAARSSNDLVVEMTNRVQHLAHGTESFAAAMQEVAASSQEQSASIEQISGAAHKLSQEAGRLSALVATFRLERRDTAEHETATTLARRGDGVAPNGEVGSGKSEVPSGRLIPAAAGGAAK